MRLLIISPSYPPDLLVSARRWGNLVPELQKHGIECTLVVGGDGSFSDEIRAGGERVFRLPIFNGPPRPDTPGEAPLSFQSRIAGRFLRYLPPHKRHGQGVKEWRRQLSEVLELGRNADVILSSYGPAGPFLLGQTLALKTGKPWVADIRDSFESKYGRAPALARYIARKMEARLLGSAAVRVTIGETLAEHMTRSYSQPFESVHNGWVDSDAPPVERRSVGARHFYYAGSVYGHQKPALEIFLNALREEENLSLKVRLLRDNSNGEVTRVLEKGVSDGIVEILPPVTPDIVQSELFESLGALVIEGIDNHPMRNGTVTGKLLGLLASGVPGIAVSSSRGQIRTLVNKVNGWHGVDSVAACRAALTDLATHPERKVDASAMAPYHMARQGAKLAGLLRVAAGKSAA